MLLLHPIFVISISNRAYYRVDMKRFALVVLVLACLISCKTDLTDIENQITKVEEKGEALENRTKQLFDESLKLSNALKELQKTSEELQKASEELQKVSEDLQKESEDLEKRSEELEKSNQALKDSLESLRKKSLELAAELVALQNEGMALSDSLDDLKAQNDLLVEEWNYLQDLIAQAQEVIEELTAKIYQTEPKLIHMEFLASENPLQLVEDAECEIIGDSAVECRVLNVMSAKSLIPRFRFTGDYVTIDGKEAVSSKTTFDFSSVRLLVVHAGEKTKKYTVTVSAYTGLPTVFGWQTHEWLWRFHGVVDKEKDVLVEDPERNVLKELIYPRQEDVDTIYEETDEAAIRAVIDKYKIEYIVLGSLEYAKFGNENYDLFVKMFGDPVFTYEDLYVFKTAPAQGAS